MPSMKQTVTLLFTLIALPTSIAGSDDGLTFCKMDHTPVGTWDDHVESGDCLQIYNFDTTGCWGIPGGFGKKGQSWLVTHGYSYCRTYTDGYCKHTYEPEEDWGVWRDYLGKDFLSFSCIPNPRNQTELGVFARASTKWSETSWNLDKWVKLY